MSDYDDIGRGYARARRPDPRIAAQIRLGLGDATSVVNVGAGAGSYEPTDLDVVAVEPSAQMIAQRPAGAARVVQATAEQLPFGDDAFDAAMAVLTVHHWQDWRAGIAELRRVARRRVAVLTWDPVAAADFWLLEYLPQMADVDAARFMPFEALCKAMAPASVSTVMIPHDCTDGFLAAYWQRPRAYLDANVRAAISSFHLGIDTGPGLARLAEDLESGAWTERFSDLLELDALDLGYRLVVSELA